MRVLILGATGMLGSALFRYLARNPGFDVLGTTRSTDVAGVFAAGLRGRLLSGIGFGQEDTPRALLAATKPDVVINCVGVVKQAEAMADKAAVIAINAMLPHSLARAAAETGARFIHISTDCVFSGLKGGYREDDSPDPVDFYGRSKLLGEIDGANGLTLRTSIIGHELGSARGLAEWFLAARGPVRGYANAIFSGLPTVELARAIEAYVLPTPELTGVWHVSGEPIAKLDLLRLFARVYDRSTEIVPDHSVRVNRSLDSSRFRDTTGYHPRAWPDSLRAMRELG